MFVDFVDQFLEFGFFDSCGEPGQLTPTPHLLEDSFVAQTTITPEGVDLGLEQLPRGFEVGEIEVQPVDLAVDSPLAFSVEKSPAHAIGQFDRIFDIFGDAVTTTLGHCSHLLELLLS